jgi:hypothetical protein
VILARGALVAGAIIGSVFIARAVGQSSALPSFERAVAPFDVVDESGSAYDLPFLGGLDVPRPQFVDIDGDGDLDLFLQEHSNQLWFFENTGSAGAPRYTWRTNRYEDLDIGEWYRFVDLDADGDVDLLSEEPISHIRMYRNVGTARAARFAPPATLMDSDGAPMFLDRQNIPSIVDLDCDGRLDFFIGRVEGTLSRWEAEAPGALRFTFITERFEDIEIIGRPPSPGPMGSSRHGANAIAFADFDGDKDLDLFWGDFFEPGILLIENIGPTCSTPSFQVEPVPLPFAGSTHTSGYNAPAPVDLDGDGDLDFLMGVIGGSFNPVATSADNFYHWARTAADRLELKTRRFLNGIDLGSDTVPAVVDLDADGDLDLVVGTKLDPASGDSGRLVFFENVGTRTAPRFRQHASLALADAYHFAPALGDLDGDGDLDLLLGTWNRDVLVFRNQGTREAPKWVEDPASAIRPPRASFSTPALADLDGDGDLDLLVGHATGIIAFYRNEGTPKAPKFTLISEQMDGIRVGRRSRPALADLDRDGLLDLIVGRESGGAAFYRNAGTKTSPKFVEMSGVDLPLAPASTPVIDDLDGDGRLDVISGTVSGGISYLRGKSP